MKKLFSICLLVITLQATAQIKDATLQASGLTCSMCSKAIYKSLVVIPFVQEVKSDIKNSSYFITFKKDASIEFDVLKKAVTEAGFSVAVLKTTIAFDNTTIKNDAHVTLQGKTYHFLNVQPQTLQGDKAITLVDKNFISSKEYKKYSKLTTMKCYETGVMQSCCTKDAATAGTRVYHVTI